MRPRAEARDATGGDSRDDLAHAGAFPLYDPPMSITTRIATTVLAVAMLARTAFGQDFIDQANALYDDIRLDQRSDLVILPVIAGMNEPPRGVETVEKAALQPASASPVWTEAKAWAEAEPQRRVLQALDEITRETDYRFAMAFGLPYGVEALVDQSDAGIEIVSADLHIDLDVGGTPLLAGADFRYFRGVRWVMCLAQVEATRLAAEGDIEGALGVLTDALFFARQIADRQFAEEMTLGIRLMNICLERMRDVVYADVRGERFLADNQDFLIDFLDLLAERTRDGNEGYIGIERLRFPQGNRLAAEQLARHVLTEQGINRKTFVPTLAALTSGNHPLMLFSQMPRWEETAQIPQARLNDALELIERVQGDFESRWNLHDPHDQMMDQRFYIDIALGTGASQLFAPIVRVLDPLRPLLDLWQQVRLEAIGTRHALALAGYEYAFHQLAPAPSSVRPRWIVDVEPDPLNPQYLRSNPGLAYIIPGRHTNSPVHQVNVVIEGYSNFQKRFRDDEFLLYSVGGDGANNMATEIQNTVEDVPGADYLIWPPVLSLLRENLHTTGQLR